MRSYRAAALLLLAGCTPMFSQFDRIAGSGSGNSGILNVSVPQEPASMSCVTGAAYSGQLVADSLQTLANGTNLARPEIVIESVWRDSNGRLRTERPMFGGMAAQRGGAPPFSLIIIQDPLARYGYLLDPVNRVAHRAPLKAPSCVGVKAAPQSGPATRTLQDGTVYVTEPLGTQVISGVPVVGVKTTTTSPAGSKRGNDKPVTTVRESWTATQFGVLLAAKYMDVDGTVSTTRMKDFTTAEPALTWFQVPADYKLVDETGPFVIQVTLRK